MGETAWGINPRILEQVQHAYQKLKGGFCGLPLHESVEDAPLPTPPSRVFRTDVYRGQLSARVSCLTIVTVVVYDPPQVFRREVWGGGGGGAARVSLTIFNVVGQDHHSNPVSRTSRDH